MYHGLGTGEARNPEMLMDKKRPQIKKAHPFPSQLESRRRITDRRELKKIILKIIKSWADLWAAHSWNWPETTQKKVSDLNTVWNTTQLSEWPLVSTYMSSPTQSYKGFETSWIFGPQPTKVGQDVCLNLNKFIASYNRIYE